MGRPRKIVELVEPQVAVPINEAEQRIKARELADLCDEIDRDRAAAAADASGARKKIRALEKRRRLLAECVRTGTELRNAQEELFSTPPPKMAAPLSDAELDEALADDDDIDAEEELEVVTPQPPPSSAEFMGAADDYGQGEIPQPPPETNGKRKRRARAGA